MTTFNKTQVICAMVALISGLMVSAGAVAQTSPAPEDKVYEVSAYSPGPAGKIGKGSSLAGAATVTLKVHVPLDVEIVEIIPEFGNQPWGEGESDYGSTAYSRAPLNGYNDESGEWHKSWARADLVDKGTTEASQFVTVKFRTWLGNNSRKARLRVRYKKIK